MMCFVDKNKFEPFRVELRYPVTGCDTLYASHSYVRQSTRMHRRHLDLDRFRRIGISTMASCLLNEFFSMCQNECLISSLGVRFYAVYELSENDLWSVSGLKMPEMIESFTVLPLPVARDTPNRL